jgi:hypothetical protein
MTNTGSAPAGNRVGAMGNLRPAPHRQFRLLPAPLPRDQPEAGAWGDRIAVWARS